MSMFTSHSGASGSQVVPQLGAEAPQDEPILTLTNPSPMGAGKGFDFLFNPSPFGAGKFDLPSTSDYAAAATPSGPSGLMTPNTSLLMSLFQATPQANANASPFVFASPAPLHDQITVPTGPTPIARAALQQQLDLKVQQQQQQQQRTRREAEQESDEASHEEDEEEQEQEQEQEHEDLAVDEEQGSDSEASFSPRQQSHQQGRKGRKRKAAQPLAGSAATYEELTDDQIAFMDFKELMRLMVAAGLTRQDIAETKARRRRLKNRQSARLCSNKKRELCSDLSSKNQQLQDTIERMQREIDRLKKDNSLLKQQMR